MNRAIRDGQWRRKEVSTAEDNFGKYISLIPSKRVNDASVFNFNSDGANPKQFYLMDEELWKFKCYRRRLSSNPAGHHEKFRMELTWDWELMGCSFAS